MTAATTFDPVSLQAGRALCPHCRRKGVARLLAVKDGRALLDGHPKRWVAIHRMYPHSTGCELVS